MLDRYMTTLKLGFYLLLVARPPLMRRDVYNRTAITPDSKASKAPPPTTALGDAAPVNGVRVDEPVGPPVAEIVPDAAGVVVGLFGIGNGAEELGTTTGAEELGTTTGVEPEVVTAACVELVRGAAEVAGFGAAEVVLPKSAGRVMPLAAAQSAGVSP